MMATMEFSKKYSLLDLAGNGEWQEAFQFCSFCGNEQFLAMVATMESCKKHSPLDLADRGSGKKLSTLDFFGIDGNDGEQQDTFPS